MDWKELFIWLVLAVVAVKVSLVLIDYFRKSEERRDAQTGEWDIKWFNNSAPDKVDELAMRLTSAEKNINRAKIEFSENAYGPFWDYIEKAVDDLHVYEKTMHEVSEMLSLVRDAIDNRGAEETPIYIDRNRLVGARNIIDELSAVVRPAQRDFQFSTIFEQRKASRILQEGVTNILQAIDQLENTIVSSTDSVLYSLTEISGKLDSVNDELRS